MGAWLSLAGPGTWNGTSQAQGLGSQKGSEFRSQPHPRAAASVRQRPLCAAQGMGLPGVLCTFQPHSWSELLRAVRALQPPSRGASPYPLCRQNHSRPRHSAVESWSGSPTPLYAPNHKLMAAEEGKSFPPGERTVAWGRGHWLGGPRRTSESGPDGAWASHRDWESSVGGRGCSCSSLAPPPEPRKGAALQPQPASSPLHPVAPFSFRSCVLLISSRLCHAVSSPWRKCSF